MSLKQETKNWLGAVKVSTIVRPETNLVTIKEDTTIEDTLNLLADKQILSVPVMRSDELLGFVDIFQILSYSTFFKSDSVDWKKPASSLIGTDTVGKERDEDIMVCVVGEDESLYKPLQCLSKGHRRVMVKMNDSSYRLATQGRLVKFLYENYDKFNLGEVKLKDANIITTPVCRVEKSTDAIEAFKKLRTQQIIGLAVTESDGTLVGSLSVTDLRGLKVDTLDRLQVPVIDFLKKQHGGEVPDVITVCPRMYLKDLLERMTSKKKHRVFVMDDEKNLAGVVTLTDIISFFWKRTMEYFTTE